MWGVFHDERLGCYWRRQRHRRPRRRRRCYRHALSVIAVRRWCWAISLFWRGAYLVSFVPLRRYHTSTVVYVLMLSSFKQVHSAVLYEIYHFQQSMNLIWFNFTQSLELLLKIPNSKFNGVWFHVGRTSKLGKYNRNLMGLRPTTLVQFYSIVNHIGYFIPFSSVTDSRDFLFGLIGWAND